ncbi:MAG: FtsX-like permease family protein [Candidatus Sumerlaeota bacterium]|nr:FtsX-like permease family protein [Candidatus Sumerlaeota bacterium]
MHFGRFVVKNVTRNKRRTAFTVLSIGFSLFLLIMLYTVLDLLTNPPSTEASALRLAVRRSTSIAEMLPLSYQQKLEQVPHVMAVMPLQWFGGYYKEPKNFFGNLATDPVKFWKLFPEYKADEATKRAFAADRRAAVCAPDLMKRFGWKVGDRVTLKGTIFPVDLEFTLVGASDFELDKSNFWFRFDYLNEAMGDMGQVGSFWLQADSPESIPGIIQTVDTMFRNSPAETLTETEKSFQLAFVGMLGNVRLMIGSISLVVVFTMLLVAASTMAMTIRERMREVAILKAIGYPRQTILGLILGESTLIGLLGVGLGILLAAGLGHMDVNAMTMGFLPFFKPPWSVYGMAVAVSAGIGFFSGLFPALQASGMTITEAMRRLE